MSTRAVIARMSNGNPLKFVGRYHHWDGYPSGLGAELYGLYRGHFDRDLDRMLAVLLDEHPAGWSTINDADWTLPIGFKDRNDPKIRCTVCDLPNWIHYKQYYDSKTYSRFLPGVVDAIKASPTVTCLVMDHPFEQPDEPRGPECYCHGGRNEPEQVFTEENAADSGCEYAYVFDGTTMHVLSSYCPDGDKMIGAFGCGDPKSTWREIGTVDLKASEPDWDKLPALAAAEGGGA